MTMKTRIAKLEQAKSDAGDNKVTCILWSIVEKQADGTLKDDTCGVHILAGPFGGGMSLYRDADESSESLRDRAAVEIIRIHGRVDNDWSSH